MKLLSYSGYFHCALLEIKSWPNPHAFLDTALILEERTTATFRNVHLVLPQKNCGETLKKPVLQIFWFGLYPPKIFYCFFVSIILMVISSILGYVLTWILA